MLFFLHRSSSLSPPPPPTQTIKEVDLQALSSLEYLDLSRNMIGELMPGTFLGMHSLKGLDFSVNAVGKVRVNKDLKKKKPALP